MTTCGVGKYFMATPADPPVPHRQRNLPTQVVGLLTAGAALGIMANELGLRTRVSYFGFHKAEILEARLSRSINEVEPRGENAAAAEPLTVVLFFTECDGCEIVRQRVIPEIERIFGGALAVRQYDCADTENYKRLIEYEKRYGSGEDEMLKLFIGDDRYLSGAVDIAENAVRAISTELAERRSAKGEP